ncbi:MAG: TetR/AcrR family transcriptional regulator [Paracoccaceae bacterium]|nr:MAG: TetR/AcrR family transcriptional regulator [Paracoccaceae bacterium]
MSPHDTAPPDRQDAILDAAFHAFAGYGYRRTSMEDIATGAGLSRTALYLHFRSKEDIFRSLSERYFDQCLADMRAALDTPGPPEEVLRAAFAAKDGKFMDVVLGTPHGRELLDAGFSIAADLARTKEAQMGAALAEWLAAHGAARSLGDPGTAAGTVLAALKGLKTSAASVADYRAGQAVLARMLALSLGQGQKGA